MKLWLVAAAAAAVVAVAAAQYGGQAYQGAQMKRMYKEPHSTKYYNSVAHEIENSNVMMALIFIMSLFGALAEKLGFYDESAEDRNARDTQWPAEEQEMDLEWPKIPLSLDHMAQTRSTKWRTAKLRFPKIALPTSAVFKFEIKIEKPTNKWIDLSKWGKGVVYINYVMLDRYMDDGTPQSLFLPKALQRTGLNVIVVHELLKIPAVPKLRFSNMRVHG